MEEIMAEARRSDEAVVFSRDAKLLRCRTNEWEDRSKAVLFLHPATGRLRFTMRQAATRAVLGQARMLKYSVLLECNGLVEKPRSCLAHAAFRFDTSCRGLPRLGLIKPRI